MIATLWPVAAFWIVALVLLRGPPVRLLCATLVAVPFGAFDVLPVPAAGWPGLAPASVLAALFVATTLPTTPGARWLGRVSHSDAALPALYAFCGVAIVATLVSVGAPRQPMALVQLVLSVLVVPAAARVMAQEGARAQLLNAMLIGAALTALTGLLDVLFSAPRTPEVLAPLRTAADTVSAAAWVERAGARPMAGLMPDPLAFGALCAMFAATAWFHRPVLPHAWLRRVTVPWLCALLALLAWLSLAPVARVAIVSVGLVVAARMAWDAMRPRLRLPRRRTGPPGRRRILLWCTFVLLALGALGEVSQRAAPMVNGLVTLVSVQSLRGEPVATRGDAAALAVVLDTRGLGRGVGHAVSAGPLAALAAGVGVLGTPCLAAFLALTWARPLATRRVEDERWSTALRWTLPCVVGTWSLSHPGADFGLYPALLFGALIAVRHPVRVRHPSADLDERDEPPHASADAAPVPPFSVEPAALVDLGEPPRARRRPFDGLSSCR